MDTVKKIVISCFLLFPTLSRPSNYFDSYNPFLDDAELGNFTESYDWTITRNQQDVINFLEDIGVINLLKEPLFLRTNLLNTRSLLDLPFHINALTYLPCVDKHKKNSGFKKCGFSIYYNQTTRSTFVRHSTDICSYLAITQNSFLTKLANVIQQLDALIPNLDINPLLIADLFKKFTVQERRFGALFSAAYTVENPQPIVLGINVPLAYHERNHFITEHEVERIENELGSPEGEPGEQHAFEDAHFISDRLGIGDTRLTIDTVLHKSPYLQAVGGLFCTVPTAITFATGVIRGRAFHPVQPRPLFDLSLLLDDDARENGTLHTQLEKFLLAALDNINSILLNTRLGNGGHFGLGAALYLKSPLYLIVNRPWAQNFKLKSRYSFEYLFPADETRYFIMCSDLHDFDNRDFNDETQTANNFDFLTQTLTNRLFPFSFPTRVSPSPIMRSTSQLEYSNGRFTWVFGSDTWIQPQERLRLSPVCSSTVTHPLNEHIAKKPFAYQGRLFTSLAYNYIGQNSIWTGNLFIDQAISGKGIGYDFTIAVGIYGTF